MATDIVILAAGKGSRMKSHLPKVLQTLAGKTLLDHVITTARQLADAQLHIVIGYGAAHVQKSLDHRNDIQFAMQSEQLGTGHAVQQVAEQLANPPTKNSKTLILYGDVPLVKASNLNKLLDLVSDKQLGLLTVKLDQPVGYGRIIRDSDEVVAIVEEKDASELQRAITEVNTGILALDTHLLKELLPQLSNQNAQGECYLTDIIALAKTQGKNIETLCLTDKIEVQGVNDKKQLAFLERAFQRQQADSLLEQGVTLIDPVRIDVRGSLAVGQDVSIDVNCIFQGTVELGDNVSIAANCIIGEVGKRVVIGSNTEIKANCIIEAAIIANDCLIGPFARIRPKTQLAEGVKIGNFVEIKKSVIDQGSKVNHLSYIGDSTIGEGVNIGAGTITCNYDGVNKHQTIIGDGVFIGSNSSLVAPVTIAKNATIGAGSAISINVKENDLAVVRARQRNISGWKRPEKT